MTGTYIGYQLDNVRKAIGPDLLPTREAAHEITPILQVIFQASIDRSEVPKDWRSANIIAVYKKETSPALLTTDQFPSLQCHVRCCNTLSTVML